MNKHETATAVWHGIKDAPDAEAILKLECLLQYAFDVGYKTADEYPKTTTTSTVYASE